MRSCIICKTGWEEGETGAFCPTCQGTLDRRVEAHKKRRAGPSDSGRTEETGLSQLDKVLEEDKKKMEAQAKRRGKGHGGTD